MTHVEKYESIDSLISGQKQLIKEAQEKGYEFVMPKESSLWFLSRKTWNSYKKNQVGPTVMVWWMEPSWRQISEKAEINCTIEVHSARFDRKSELLIPNPKLI